MKILVWGLCVCTSGEMTMAFFRFPKGYVTPDRKILMQLGPKRDLLMVCNPLCHTISGT